MPKFIRYAGHRYRLAQDPEAEAPAEAPEQQQTDPCTTKIPANNPFVQAAEKLLSAAGVTGTPRRLCREADGFDVQVDVGAEWSGIDAMLTFDLDQKANLQELVLTMCRLNFAAQTGRFGGGKTIQMLLVTLRLLQSMEFGPEVATNQVENKKKAEYVEFLKYYIAELLMGAVELPYENRKEFAAALAKMENIPQQRRDTMVEGALKWMTDQDWQNEIVPLIQSDGRQYAATQDLINRAVSELIPKHENYTGAAHLIQYLDDGSMVVAIEVPKPVQSFLFIFRHPAGQKKLQFVEAGMGVCGGTFWVKSDVNKARMLVSAMVNLAILHGRTANPELSQPPKPIAKQWDRKTWERESARGLVIWENKVGGRRLVWKGDENAPCYSKEEWENETTTVTVKNKLDEAERKKTEVFLVRPNGEVDQLDYTGSIVQKNIYQVDPTAGRACPVGR